MQISGKRIVITGAASGIGKALLELLSEIPETRIVAADLKAETIPAQVGRVYPLCCDLSTQEGTDLIIRHAIDVMGGVDLYIANAGFAYYEQLPVGADWKRLEKIYSTNVLTPIYSFQKVRELAAGKPFRVVVTASAMGYLAIPGYAIYGATKASLVSFADAFRWELKDPCALTLLNPIATRTSFFRQGKSDAPLPFPSQTPEYVAHYVLRAIQADQPNIFPSKIFRLTLLLNRILPLVGWVYQYYQNWILRRWTAKKEAEASSRSCDQSA
ncbi:MAG: SDR family NAD(P)-dependent oxidoreductase [Oligoflexus sp.]|nr:SDR family NAD(P)-dependent oxidoreductase [Oligoflexus sp.]